MIERYTIKFAPAVSQKEPEKALNEGRDAPHIHKLRGKIEFIGDFEDVKKLSGMLKELSKKESSQTYP